MTFAESIDTANENGGNRSGFAYRVVSQMIRDKRLAGGQLIVEARLAETLGISRTPLREALQRLEGEGRVVKAANRSFMVRTVDLGEYLQSMKVRELIEGEAAALSAGRATDGEIALVREEIEMLKRATTYHTDAHWRSDDNVHNLIADSCGNPVLGGMVRGLRVTTQMFQIARFSERSEDDMAEHLTILDALGAGDGRRARKATQSHIRSLHHFALRSLS